MATTNGVQIAMAKGAVRTTWTLTGTNDGLPEVAPQYPNKTVHLTGTFGGGTVVIEGSNDGVTYTTLTDLQGNALTITAPAIEKIEECPQYVRPRASVGVTSVVIAMTSESGRR